MNKGVTAGLFISVFSLFFFEACVSNQGDIKFQQYFVGGEQLYEKHCSNCHRPSGKGLGRVYPPLAQSDYMNDNFEEVICLMKYGRAGEIVVNGKSYNKEMPGIPSLTELEIAEIATYIYGKWGNSQRVVETQEIEKILKKCSRP